MGEGSLHELLNLVAERERAEQRWDEEAGRRLREARSAAGLSQGEFAAAAGTSQPYLSAVETGRTRVSPGMVRRYHSVLESFMATTQREDHGDKRKRNRQGG